MLQLCALPHPNLPLTTAFNFRRVLENTDHYLVEVKRTGNVDILLDFQWLKISKDLDQINSLNLKTIDSSYQVEERFFDEGYLKFNASTGIFIEKFNSGQHQYQIINDLELTNSLSQLLDDYFSNRRSLMN